MKHSAKSLAQKRAKRLGGYAKYSPSTGKWIVIDAKGKELTDEAAN